MLAPPATGRPSVGEVDTVDALGELEPEWADLFADARGVTPFLHPAWLMPWCEAFGVERVCAAVVRNRSDGRLIALQACLRAPICRAEALPHVTDAVATHASAGS